jgi:hypothetical protein
MLSYKLFIDCYLTESDHDKIYKLVSWSGKPLISHYNIDVLMQFLRSNNLMIACITTLRIQQIIQYLKNVKYTSEIIVVPVNYDYHPLIIIFENFGLSFNQILNLWTGSKFPEHILVNLFIRIIKASNLNRLKFNLQRHLVIKIIKYIVFYQYKFHGDNNLSADLIKLVKLFPNIKLYSNNQVIISQLTEVDVECEIFELNSFALSNNQYPIDVCDGYVLSRPYYFSDLPNYETYNLTVSRKKYKKIEVLLNITGIIVDNNRIIPIKYAEWYEPIFKN